MNLYSNFALLAALYGFVLAAIVYWQSKHKNQNKIFALVTFLTALWTLAPVFVAVFRDWDNLLLLIRFLYLGVVFIPPVFLHMMLIVSEREKIKYEKIILYICYLISLFFIFNVFGIKFIDSLKLNSPFFSLYPGFLYNLFFLFFAVIGLYGSLKPLLAFRNNPTGYIRMRLKFFSIASMAGILSGLMHFFAVYIDLEPFPHDIFVIIYFSTIAYAVTRYRLMDIRAIVFRSLAFALIISIIAGAYSIITVIISRFFADLVGATSNIWAGLIVAILVVVGYHPLRRLIENVTNRFLYKKSYDPDVVQDKIEKAASSTLNLEELLTSVCGILTDAFHCEKIGVVLLSKKGKLYVEHQEGFRPGEAEALAQGKERVLALQLKQTPGLLVLDEMKTRYENGEFKPVSPKALLELYEHDLALIIPLYVKGKLKGIFVLGAKKSGDPYNQADLQLLNHIEGQAAIAIENASLYEEQKRFAENLRVEVDKATAQLRDKNKELKQADESKSEFISIASHQLRTPLTHIKGGLSMILEGDYGNISDRSKDIMEKLFISNERLIILVRDLLNLSRIEAGKMEYEWKKVDLNKLAEEVVFMQTQSARQKGLKLELMPAKVPLVEADEGKLHEIMYNFVDNAIKYSKQGEIIVSLKAEPAGLVTFSVQDNGMGISKENIPKLFKKFSRGRRGFLTHTEGVGIGLFVARKFIEAHEGKAWVKSAGEGKGATFSFSVPIAGPKVKPKLVSREVAIKTPAQLREEARR